MKPLWSDERALPTFDAQNLEGRFDVAVVGAGLTGLVTALLLARRGHRVVVLEARAVGSGTSGATTAKATVLQGTRASSIAAKHPRETVQQYLAGNRFGLDWLVRFCTRNAVPFQRPSAVTYAPTNAELDRVQSEYDLLLTLGVDVRWSDTARVPFDFAGGVEVPEQLQCDPVDLLTAIADQARKAGVTLATGQRVTDIGTDRDPQVRTVHGTVKADRVVLATGIPIADRGGFFARVVPERSYLVAVYDPEAEPLDMYWAASTPVRSIRTVPAGEGQWILVGGNSHQVGRAESEAANVEDLRLWALRHFGGNVTHAWGAQDYHPIDELPYVGPLLPTSDRVLIASGFAKWGMTNAVAAGAVLAGHFGGAMPPWAKAHASWSTHELAGAAAGVGHNVRAMTDMAKDRIAALTTSTKTPEEGTGCVARRGGQPVATSTVGGHTRSVSATCPHMGGLVHWNDAELTWDCPLHGSRFTAAGELLEGPATSDLAAVEEDDADAGMPEVGSD